MKKFNLFTVDDRSTSDHNNARMNEFTAFLNALSSARKRYTVTTWSSDDGHENGFCVWYN